MAVRLTWPRHARKDTYTGVSFQNRDVVDKLMKHGSVTGHWGEYPNTNKAHVKPMRYDKTKFYLEHMGLDFNDEHVTLPFYAFNNLPSYFYDMYIEDFCSTRQISAGWGSLMGYYRLEDRCFIQLELPKQNCIRGLLDKVELFDGVTNEDNNIELVFNALRMEDVVEIYIPAEDFCSTYGKIKFKSILNNNQKAMFSGECYFSGSSYYHNDLLSKEPIKGLTLIENASRLTDDALSNMLETIYLDKHGYADYDQKTNLQKHCARMNILHQYKDYILLEV